MKLAQDDLLAALRLRYDHYSARSTFDNALARAGLPDQPTYDVAQVAAFRAALARVGDRLGPVEAALDRLLGAAPASQATPAEPSPPPEPAPPVTSAPVESAPEPVAEKKPAKKPKADKGEKTDKHAKLDKADLAVGGAPVETRIALTGVKLEPGEQLLVCGDIPELGAWEAAQACPMVAEGDAFVATIRLVPGTTSAFKLLCKAPDGKLEWETGDNRELVAGERIVTTWR